MDNFSLSNINESYINSFRVIRYKVRNEYLCKNYVGACKILQLYLTPAKPENLR